MSKLTSKRDLRASYLAIRAGVRNRAEKEAALLRLLLNLPAFQDAKKVFCFVSFDSEPDTHAFLEECFRLKKSVAVPRCEENGRMRFFGIRSLSELTPTPPYQILEPCCDAPEMTADENTFCVVPGLSFDMAGHRLGYGAGYYDRFLATFSGTSVGLCFSECLAEALPVEDNDCPVQMLLTENGAQTLKSSFA